MPKKAFGLTKCVDTFVHDCSHSDQSLVPDLEFEAKVTSSHDETCPRDLLHCRTSYRDMSPRVCQPLWKCTRNKGRTETVRNTLRHIDLVIR